MTQPTDADILRRWRAAMDEFNATLDTAIMKAQTAARILTELAHDLKRDASVSDTPPCEDLWRYTVRCLTEGCSMATPIPTRYEESAAAVGTNHTYATGHRVVVERIDA